jgi:filamentous hemagglutinin
LISATGNVTGGNVNTTNISLSGNVISALNVTGNTTSGNLLTPGLVSAVGNVIGGNVSTTGNVTAANVTTPVVRSSATMAISTGSGDLTLNPSGNVAVSSKNIVNLADPVQDQDAATKAYVDSVAQGLDIKASVLTATANTLAVYSGGTVSYNNGTAGVGATLTTTGTYTTIDGSNVQTANTRVLVKNEANATWNGIYVYSNSTVLTRSADFNQPNEVASAYTFVETGTTWADTGWVCTTNNPVVFGTTSIVFAQFSGAGSYTANTAAGISLTGSVFSALVDNNTTAFDGGGNIIVKAGANLTTPNIGNATGQSLQLTTSGGNGLLLATTVSSTGNTIAGNVTTVGLVSATGNVTGGNVLTGGLVSATGNLTSGNVNTTNISLSGNVISALNVTGNVSGGNILTVGLVSATGNVNGGNVISSALVQGVTVSASGNVIGGNVSTVGLITATGNVTGGNLLTGGLVSATGNATSGNVLTGGLISATGNITGGNLLTTGSGGAISGTGNITGGNILTGGLISATGTLAAGNTTITGFANVSNGVISVGSYVGANITDGIIVDYVTGNGRISVGSADGLNIYNGPQAGNTLIASFNTTGALTLGTTGTANLTAGNALISGQVSATANVTGGNILTGGQVSATGNGTFGNIVLTGNFINQLQANSVININGASANTNFAVNGTTANLIYVNATNNTIGFGNSATLVNAIASFNSTTSIVLPTGNTGVRPSNASSQTGMVRFNTTLNALEIYDNTHWTSVGGTTFTVISDEQFNGDGSTVQFTLGSTQTTNSCIVSINGIVQIPGTAYSVAGTYPTCYLTFTEAPAVADLIDVRELTTTTSVTSVANNSGNAQIAGNATAAQMDITGNLVMTNGTIFATNILNQGANGTGNIGNSSTYFNTIFAKATSAQYADLAEKYVADAEYAPGTVVSFGGEKEVTRSEVDGDRAVAGVVSTNPSYIMNAALEAEHVAVVAFTGRVPTSVTGSVAKGDLMVSNGDGTARADTDPKAGSIIGKALENFSGDAGVIEVVIGRF